MRNKELPIILILAIVFTSCSSVQVCKRRYRKAFHVQLKDYKSQGNFLTSNAKSLREVEVYDTSEKGKYGREECVQSFSLRDRVKYDRQNDEVATDGTLMLNDETILNRNSLEPLLRNKKALSHSTYSSSDEDGELTKKELQKLEDQSAGLKILSFLGLLLGSFGASFLGGLLIASGLYSLGMFDLFALLLGFISGLLILIPLLILSFRFLIKFKFFKKRRGIDSK